MQLRLDSPMVRLYCRAYVEDRAWLVALGLTPQVECVPEDVRRQIVGKVPDLETRQILLRAWLLQENDRLNTEAAQAVREQMDKGRLSLCPFFWKTMAAIFVYGMVCLPLRAVFNFVDRFLFSPVVSAGEAAAGWFERVFTRRVLVGLGTVCASGLFLFSLNSGFWNQVADQFRLMGHELVQEAERNRASKARYAEEVAKAQADAQLRAQSEQTAHEIWALAYPERAQAEAQALQQAAAEAAQARARRAAAEARWREQARAEEWRNVGEFLITLAAFVGLVIGATLLVVAFVWFLDLLDKAVDLTLGLFVLVAFINYPGAGQAMGWVVDGIWDFGRMCWNFAKAVKARACPLLQFQ